MPYLCVQILGTIFCSVAELSQIKPSYTVKSLNANKPMDAVELQGMQNRIPPATLRELADEACGVLKQLANALRLMALCHLAEGEKTVGELQALIGLEQSSPPQHLAKLRNEGIIRARRNSRLKRCSIVDEKIFRIIASPHSIYCVPAE